MDAQQQRVEVQAVRAGDDYFAIQDAALGQRRAQGRRQLREVAVERFEVAALDESFVAVAEDQRPEAVPLGLVEPAIADRNRLGQLGQHRFDRRLEWQVHAATIPGRALWRPPNRARLSRRDGGARRLRADQSRTRQPTSARRARGDLVREFIVGGLVTAEAALALLLDYLHGKTKYGTATEGFGEKRNRKYRNELLKEQTLYNNQHNKK